VGSVAIGLVISQKYLQLAIALEPSCPTFQLAVALAEGLEPSCPTFQPAVALAEDLEPSCPTIQPAVALAGSLATDSTDYCSQIQILEYCFAAERYSKNSGTKADHFQDS